MTNLKDRTRLTDLCKIMFKILKNVKNNIKTSKRGDNIVLFLCNNSSSDINNIINRIYNSTNTYSKFKVSY